MMKIFKFKINKERTQVRGEFVSYGNDDEIVGIIKGKDGNIASFIKGLFFDKKKLIFIVISKEKHYRSGTAYHDVKGYSFKDINKPGVFDEDGRFLDFCAKREPATIKIYEAKGYERVANIRREFKDFYKTLDDRNQFRLYNVQELRDLVNYIKYI